MIDSATVQKTAQLAQLEVSAERASYFGAQFANILKDFSTLEKVDTQGVIPMVTPLDNMRVMREDQAVKSEKTQGLLGNAPDSRGSLYKVPPVV